MVNGLDQKLELEVEVRDWEGNVRSVDDGASYAFRMSHNALAANTAGTKSEARIVND
jgi:hypothetical protein